MKILLLLIILVFSASASLSQDENVSDIIASIVEEIADDESDPEAVTLYIEKLHELNEDPVLINSADESYLSRLFFLTDFQIKAIADYVSSSGRIISVFEIANIPGFDREQTEMLIPFISLDAEKPDHRYSKRFRNNLLTNLSVRHPVSDTTSQGSPWKSLTRYKFTAGRFSGGFTAEKDAGEKFCSSHPPLPDFLSANLEWNGSGIFRRVIFGDYGARFGLGTGINTGLRTGLSLTQSGYLSGGDEIKPYTSSDENNFFRGAAAQIQLKKTGISLFYSLNNIDATVDTAGNGSDIFVKTFQRSGLHNTISSGAKKDAVKESFYAINLVSDFDNLRLGLLWTGCRFSIPVKTDHTDPENIFDFEGVGNYTATAYYKAIFGDFVLYGEGSANINKRFALIQGLIFRPSGRLTINLLYRDYNPGFTTFHGKGPFSTSAGDNSRGLFGNFTFEAARHLFITAGCDIRYFPWLKYRCSAPSMAISREMRMKYLPSDRLTVEALYSYRSSILDDHGNYGIVKQTTTINRILKGRVRYSPDSYLTLSTRFDYKITQPGSRRGMLLLQDISYNFRKIPVSVWLRYCLFKTDDWESRLYAYENDLLYSFSIPALSGEGSRSCIMVTWKARKLIYLRIKYGLTETVADIDRLKEIKELRMQVRMWF